MTAHLPASASRALATWNNDPFRATFGDRIEPDPLALPPRGAARGLAVFRALEGDGEVGAGLQKRKAAVIGRRWEISPGADTPAGHAAAELVRAALFNLNVEQLIGSCLDALLMGVSIVEVIWTEAPAGVLVPLDTKHRDQLRFTFRDAQPEPELRLLTRAQPQDGEAVPERKFIVHRHGSRYGNPWGQGLGPVLFWPVFFKRRGIAFWVGALERFGQPTAIGRYPAGTPEEEQKKLLHLLATIGTDAGAILPQGMTVELLEGLREAGMEGHAQLARYMDAQIALAICGATLESRGHLRSVQLLAMADAAHLASTLYRTLLHWIVDLNMPGAPIPSIRWDFTDPRASAKRAEVDAILFSMGYRLREDRLRERYGTGYQMRAPERRS
jgi:phage gp29-like protein